MQIKAYLRGEQRPLPASAKRMLALITLRALMVSSNDPGESNEFYLVLRKQDYEASFPSLRKKRLQELLRLLCTANFTEPKLGYSEQFILMYATSLDDGGSVNLIVSSAYMDCIFKLGCLPV